MLKAMRKVPERRYATVAQLSDDVRRHLEHRPVIARKGTTRYIASRFLARHRVVVAAAAIVGVILVVGVVMVMREAYLADKRFRDVRRLANSLIFEIHDSIKDLPGSTSARKLIVERALEYLDSLAKESPGDISLQRELASAYERVGLVQGQRAASSLGDLTGGVATLRKSLIIRQRIAARTSDSSDLLDLARTYRLSADDQRGLGDIPHAKQSIRTGLHITEGLNQSHPNQWDTLKELAYEFETGSDVEQGGYALSSDDAAQGDAYDRAAMEIHKQMLQMRLQDVDTLCSYSNDMSSMGYRVRGKNLHQSLKYFQQGLSIDQKLHSQSPDVRYARNLAGSYEEVADIYERLHDYTRQVENDLQSLEIMSSLLVADPRNTHIRQSLAISLINTSSGLRRVSRLKESIEDTRKSLEMEREVVAADRQNQEQLGFLAELAIQGAFNFLSAKLPEDAMNAFNESYAIFESIEQKHPGDATRNANIAMLDVERGMIEQRAGNAAQAGVDFRRALNRIERYLNTEKEREGVWAAAAATYSAIGDLSRRNAGERNQDMATRRKDWSDAQSWYLKSLAAWQQSAPIINTFLHNFEVPGPEVVAQNLANCKRELANLHRIGAGAKFR